MTDPMFQPPASLRARIAPTEGTLRGVVHDPTARFMGGVAGHAGLFSKAADPARFSEMLLGKGSRQAGRIFIPLTLDTFPTPPPPPTQPSPPTLASIIT